VVTAKASTSSITVNTAVDLSANSGTGFPFTIRHQTCDYSDDSGWVNVGGLDEPLVYIGVNALTATGGVDYSIECRLTAADVFNQTLTGNFTTAIVVGVPPPTTAADIFVIAESCGSIRVGLKFGTTDTAGTDSVSAYLSAVKRN
jgi:hypothetical protein